MVRPDLSTEAIRLGRLLVALVPDDGETIALLALMLLHDARRAARVGAGGELIPLEEQDRSSWDGRQFAEGLDLVDAALVTGPVVTLNLLVALAMVEGPSAALVELDQQSAAGRLDSLPGHRVPAVRAHLLERAGRHVEAAAEFRRAAAAADTEPERAHLHRRLASVTG